MSILRNLLRRPPQSVELFGSFTSMEQWRDWLGTHPEVTDPRYIQSIVQRAQHGVVTPLSWVRFRRGKWCSTAPTIESVCSHGLNLRLRTPCSIWWRNFLRPRTSGTR